MLRHEAWCAGHLLKLTLPWKWSPWHSLFASIIATFVIMMLIFYHSQAWYTPQFLNTNQSIALLEEKTTIEHINTPDKSSQTSSIIINHHPMNHQSSSIIIPWHLFTSPLHRQVAISRGDLSLCPAPRRSWPWLRAHAVPSDVAPGMEVPSGRARAPLKESRGITEAQGMDDFSCKIVPEQVGLLRVTWRYLK